MNEKALTLLVQKLGVNATLPVRSSDGARELCTAHDLVATAKHKALIKTDCAVCAPSDIRLHVVALPAFAWRCHVSIAGANADKRGIAVVLFTHGDSELVIRRGDTVARLLLQRVAASEIGEVQELPGPLVPRATETTTVPKRRKCRRGRRSDAAVEKPRRPPVTDEETE